MAKSRYGKTRQGFQITNCLTDRYGRTTIVAKRANDYIVAKGYNQRRDGTWAPGYYNFPTRKSALNFAKRESYRR